MNMMSPHGGQPASFDQVVNVWDVRMTRQLASLTFTAPGGYVRSMQL